MSSPSTSTTPSTPAAPRRRNSRVVLRTDYHVTHTMADGTVRESLDGYVIPFNEQTEGIYRVVGAIVRKQMIGRGAQR